MASPYGLFRGSDPGANSPVRRPSPSGSNNNGITSSPEDGLLDEVSMLSVEKVHLLTFTSTEVALSLQVFDSEDAFTDLSSSITRQTGDKAKIDVLEDIRFGFGIVFNLAGRCESLRLVYHEALLLHGQCAAGYSEAMGCFRRLESSGSAYYYCPRETAIETRQSFDRAELEVSIRTETGVELWSRRWGLNIWPKSENIYLGEPTARANSLASSELPPSYSPQPVHSRNSSCDSLGAESFIELDAKELESQVRPNPLVQSSPPPPNQPTVLKQVGMLLYGSRLGQYVARTMDSGNQRTPKTTFRAAPLWLLGIKYDLKSSHCESARSENLISRRAEATLTFNRPAYIANGPFTRLFLFSCRYACDPELVFDTIYRQAVARQWAVEAGDKYSMCIRRESAKISTKIFSANNGVVVEFSLTSTSHDTAAISFLVSAMRTLQFKLGLLSSVPLLGRWRGSTLPEPDSNICHVAFPWRCEDQTPIQIDITESCLFWDPCFGEWIDASFSLGLYGLVRIVSEGFVALDLAMNQMIVQFKGNVLVLTKLDGREYHVLIKDVVRRASISSKLYLHSASSQTGGKPVKSPVEVFRRSCELQLLQAATERQADAERREKINAELIQEFIQDFSCRLWFTYRRDMPRLANTLLTTDAGWGCLVRCGQMMVGEAYARVLMGRGWNFIQLECGGVSPEMYQSILALFQDQVVSTAPFGLHAIVYAGAALGHPIGQWFSPTLLAHVCGEQSRKTFPMHFLVLPIENGVFALSSLRGLVSRQPVLLMIPLRLGLEAFNPCYLDLLTGCLELPQSIGVIGGRPGKCFYIVGHQQGELFYLDPHVTREPPPHPVECMITREFHTDVVLSMECSQLDPSLMFGFLVRNPADLEALITDLTRLNMRVPVFSFMP